MPITMVAADPHPIFLLGLRQLMTNQSDMDLLACCLTIEKTRAAIQHHQPDILVIDINLEGQAGLELIRELKQQKKPQKIVVLTSSLDDEQTIETLRLEVEGVLLKEMPMQLLMQCLHKVKSGGQWLEKKSIGHAFEKMLQREAGARRLSTILTERETEVMCLVATGLSNREIATKLSVSEGTVKIHVHNIYGKLGISNRVDLTLYAQKKGVV